jgi:hypothetical protein
MVGMEMKKPVEKQSIAAALAQALFGYTAPRKNGLLQRARGTQAGNGWL